MRTREIKVIEKMVKAVIPAEEIPELIFGIMRQYQFEMPDWLNDYIEKHHRRTAGGERKKR